MKPYRINLIVEGNEEECLFEIVKEKGLANNIDLMIRNAYGYGNIGAIFQGRIVEEEIDAIFAVYDVDNRQIEKGSPYNVVRKHLKDILGGEKAVDAASLCTNPNIMQFLLLGCDTLDKVALLETSKERNTPLIHHYWKDIGNSKKDEKGQIVSSPYNASQWQLAKIKESFIYDFYRYDDLLKNAKDLSIDYKNQLPAGNLFPFLNALKNGDIPYFEKLMKSIRPND